MPTTLRTVFHSELLSIRHVLVRPVAVESGDVERETADLLVLPVAGLFAKHEGPRHKIIANPNHALFFGHDKPYRVSFPGGVGDECLVLEFSRPALATLLSDALGLDDVSHPELHTHALLSPESVLQRSWLRRTLAGSCVESVAVEEVGMALLVDSARAACKRPGRKGHAKHTITAARRAQQIEAVKEAISLHPGQDWSLESLARLANTSAYHLTRIFRTEVGSSVHHYVMRTRLLKGLDSVLAANDDLTGIAHDMGFGSHSHFTASFRTFFGMTPSQLRAKPDWRRRSELSRILIA